MSGLGKLLGVTFPIIKTRVGGEGGAKTGKDVKRINQLLRLAKYLNVPGDDSQWNKASEKALTDFYNRWKGVTRQSAAYIDPKDPFDFLCTLAQEAGVLIALPRNLRSASAIKLFYDTCVARKIIYGWEENGVPLNGGTRTIWGFEGRPGWAVSTVRNSNGDCFFDLTTPTSLNCTSFANLMMSVWLFGTAHEKPYDSSQMVGGDYPLGWRYWMQTINDNNLIFDGYCFDAEAVKNCMKPNQLYHVGLCKHSDGFITHDTVALNGEIYEYNKYAPYVFKTKVVERVNRTLKGGGGVRILGPSPF